MRYYSTNHQSPKASLAEAISHSQAPDGGLYMPDSLPRIPKAFFNNIAEMSDSEISYFVANNLFGSDFSSSEIKSIGESTFSFPIPLVEIEPRIYALELFHGPTNNVKDIASRFTARMLKSLKRDSSRPLNVLISTNGNSGTAIAYGCLDLEGVNVFALYPRTTPPERARQISSLGNNVHAIRVDGTIDDCRRMLNQAISDTALNEEILLTSANSVNIGRVLPHSITYFIAYARLMAIIDKESPIYVSVPCGNSGCLIAGYFAKMMGLPIEKFVAACNYNGSFARYLANGQLDDCPPASTRTLAYAMDMCRPTNAPRFHDVCGGDASILHRDILPSTCSDDEIRHTIRDVYDRTGYVLDPHSAVAYKGLKEHLPQDACGIVMASAHPCRSAATVSEIIGRDIFGTAERKPESQTQGKPAETIIAPTFPALKKYIHNTLQQR